MSFGERLRAAFEFLEQTVAERKDQKLRSRDLEWFSRRAGCAQGIIRWRQWWKSPAKSPATHHHFRFIQLPVNLAMPEALFFQNQKLGDEYVSVVEAAQAFGVT